MAAAGGRPLWAICILDPGKGHTVRYKVNLRRVNSHGCRGPPKREPPKKGTRIPLGAWRSLLLALLGLGASLSGAPSQPKDEMVETQVTDAPLPLEGISWSTQSEKEGLGSDSTSYVSGRSSIMEARLGQPTIAYGSDFTWRTCSKHHSNVCATLPQVQKSTLHSFWEPSKAAVGGVCMN